MKKFLLLFFVLASLWLAVPCQAQNYDFSAVAPSGQTLYYSISDNTVSVVRQFADIYHPFTISGDLIIPDSVYYNGNTYLVTLINTDAFCNCQFLTSVTIPNTVTQILPNAFSGCSLLNSVTIPNSVTTINHFAFQSCTSLTSITIPDSILFLGDYAFDQCASLTEINIPNTITSINPYLFQGCSSLTDITIPNSVTNIGPFAFSGCSSLVNITISDSVTYIGHYAFYNCSALDSVTIPNSVTYIGSYAFSGCTSLSNVILSNSITSISSGTFQSSSLTNISIPNSVLSINVQAFSGCTSLSSVSFPNSLTYIDDLAFQDCSSLVSISIPSSVSHIGGNIFENAGIDTVTVFWENPIPLNNNVHLLNADVINIPCGTTYNYQTVWGVHNYYEPEADVSFILISPQEERGTATIVQQNGSNVACGDSTAIIQATSNYGYHFVQWNNGNIANPDTLHLYGDSVVFALFNKNLYSVGGVSAEYNEPRGVVIGGTVEYLDTVALTAIPNYGYHFTHWNDWNQDNPRQVVATQDLSYTASFDYNQYHISLDVDTTIHGDVSGAGDYNYLSQPTIEATANYGYHFAQWSDGNTDNPRTITLTQDTILTAFFNKNLYSVEGYSEEYSELRGVVTGSDTIVEYMDTVTLMALPNYGYHFTQWNDGNTDNPRQVIAWGDMIYTASFDYNQYNIVLAVDTVIHGTVSGAGDYNYLSQLTIEATANYGYHFIQWDDGNTDNPRTITLTQDTTFTAFFEKNQYALTVLSNDDTIGSVMGSGTYDYLDMVLITATTTAPHHHFVVWSDGVTDALRTITLMEDLTLTAIFAIDTHHVNLMVNDANYGYATGVGDYPYGSTVFVNAIPYSGYYFREWNNGDINASFSFTLTNDTSFIAIFSPEIIPSLCMVTVQDDHNVLLWEKEQIVSEYHLFRESVVAGEYELIATVPYDSLSTLVDTSSRPRTRSYRYRISAADIYGHEADMSDIHKTMHLTISQGIGNQWNLVWTEYEGTDYNTYVIYRGSNPTDMNQIDVMPSGGNTTYTDDSAPAGDVYYQVGIMLLSPCNPTKSDFIVRSNVATNSSTGIHEVQADNIWIYAHNGQITVVGEYELQDVQIYDLSGKLLKTVCVNGNNTVINISDFATGIYLVRVNTENGSTINKVLK